MSDPEHPLLNRTVLNNPYPAYARLRETAAVLPVGPPLSAWLVTRYEDVGPILKNPALFSSRCMDFSQRMNSQLSAELRQWARADNSLLATDPPVHTRLRQVVSHAFTPRRVAELEPRVRAITRELLEPLLREEEPDFVAGLAVPLPLIVIAELLGVEPERRHDFKRWSEDTILASALSLSPVDPARLETSLRAMHAYLREAIAERRRAPREDLISGLLEAEPPEAPLTEEDVLSFCRLLLVAGTETTTNLLGNGMLALVRHPGEWERLVAHPALVPQAVEEMLRYDSPVQGILRETTQQAPVAGQVLPAGCRVMVLVGSAHRDPRRFPDAERFDITRDTQGHYALGHGIHFCLGAPLARLEARVVLEEWVRQVARVQLAPGQEAALDWGASLFVRGPRALRLKLERRA